MTKKEIYFIILVPLCYLVCLLTPVWLVALDILPSGFLNVTGAFVYILCAVGSFTIPSVLMFFYQKRKQSGTLTHRQAVVSITITISFFVLLTAYAFLTFLLPLMVDYPTNCCPGCPSAYVCWVALPIPQTLFTTTLIVFVILSGISLPFFVLWVKMLWIEKTQHSRKDDPSWAHVKNG